MRILFKVLIFSYSILASSVVAQKKVLTDCNTIYLCIDSISYKQVFSNPFIRDTIFICVEQTTNTLDNNYSGKYAIGKSATLEFFMPKPIEKAGNHLNDFGVEFKTRRYGSLDLLTKRAQKNRMLIDTSLTQLNDQDTVLAWYKTLSLSPPKSNFELCILEYQKEYLNYLGFDKDEILNPMTYEYYNQKLSNGKKYPRQFSKIKSVTIQLHKNQMDQLKAFCLLNQMKQKANTFYNDEFAINFEIVDQLIISKINKIEIELVDVQAERIIEVSNNLMFKISNKTCEIVFKNNH
jgi:hypothetical protein